jgi:hypothetical protein
VLFRNYKCVIAIPGGASACCLFYWYMMVVWLMVYAVCCIVRLLALFMELWEAGLLIFRAVLVEVCGWFDARVF